MYILSVAVSQMLKNTTDWLICTTYNRKR